MTTNASGPMSTGRRRRPAVMAATMATTLALAGAACGDDGGDRSAGSAATTAAAAPASTSAPTSTAPGAGIDWAPCDPGFECAKVPVPLDWGDPSGEQIELSVIRYPATKPDQRIGSMFFNPGGPGDTRCRPGPRRGPQLSEAGDGRFDIVSWDPRGTHASSPMHCFADRRGGGGVLEGRRPSRTQPSSRLPIQLRLVDLAQRCGEVMGELLSHISTADTARDLDAPAGPLGRGADHLRRPLLRHHARPDLRQHVPARVRAMMLDGVVDGVPYTASAEDRAAEQRRVHRCRLRPVRRTLRARRPDPVRARRPSGTDRGAARRPAVRHASDRHHPRAQRRPARRAGLQRPPAHLVLRSAGPEPVAGVGRAAERRRRR